MAARKTKAEPAAAAEIEAVGKPGLGIDEGVVLTTFFLLAIAIALVLKIGRAHV